MEVGVPSANWMTPHATVMNDKQMRGPKRRSTRLLGNSLHIIFCGQKETKSE
jgi:hypothetical protein